MYLKANVFLIKPAKVEPEPNHFWLGSNIHNHVNLDFKARIYISNNSLFFLRSLAIEQNGWKSKLQFFQPSSTFLTDHFGKPEIEPNEIELLNQKVNIYGCFMDEPDQTAIKWIYNKVMLHSKFILCRLHVNKNHSNIGVWDNCYMRMIYEQIHRREWLSPMYLVISHAHDIIHRWPNFKAYIHNYINTIYSLKYITHNTLYIYNTLN